MQFKIFISKFGMLKNAHDEVSILNRQNTSFASRNVCLLCELCRDANLRPTFVFNVNGERAKQSTYCPLRQLFS